MVLSLHRATLQIRAQELRDPAGLQETMSPASFATVLDAGGGDSRAHALEAGARRVELLECVPGPLPLSRLRPLSFPAPKTRSQGTETSEKCQGADPTDRDLDRLDPGGEIDSTETSKKHKSSHRTEHELLLL